MPTTPVSRGRPPLLPVSENVYDVLAPSSTEAQKGRVTGSQPTPTKRNRIDSRSPGRTATLNSRCNYETPFVDDRGGKKSKTLPSGKRVSFGGNSIRIISQTGHNSFSKASVEDQEASPGYLEERLPTPPISTRNPDMLSGINDDSDMDTFSATRLPSRVSDSPSRAQLYKDLSNPIRSSDFRRSSTLRMSGRQSFGLFVDEDVTMACRDLRIDPTEDDFTQTLPSVPLLNRESPMPDDVDVTCTLGYGFRDIITEANQDEKLIPNRTKISSTSSGCVSSDQLGDDMGIQENERPSVAIESQNMEHNISIDRDESARHIHENSTRQDQPSSPSHRLQDSSIENSDSGKALAVEIGVKVIEPDHSKVITPSKSQNQARTESEPQPLIPPEEDDQDSIGHDDKGEDRNKDIQPITAETTCTSESSTRDSGVISTSAPDANFIQNQNALLRSRSQELPKQVGAVDEDTGHDPSAEQRGLLGSAINASDSDAVEKNPAVQRPTDFNLDHHLRGIDVRFDNPTRSVGREASLAPIEALPSKFEPSSSELISYELMKERYYLEHLRKEKKRIKSVINSTREAVKALEKEIETLRPPMVEMLTKYDEHSTKRITAFQCAVKRLRKTSAFEARGEWVTSRKAWEKDICNGMVQCCTALEKDLERTRAKKASITDFANRFSELEELSHFQKNYEEEGMETLSVIQRIFVREMSQFKTVREDVITQERYRKDAQRKQALLEPLEAKLLRECSELESYVGKGSPALRKMILEKHEQSSIIAGVTGISLSKINTNSIALTICGLVNLHFSLHEDRVINMSCKPVRFFSKENTSALKNLIEGAVMLSSFAARIRAVKMVRDIPMALRRFSHVMMRTQCLLEDAHRYYELHVGSISNSLATEDEGSPSLHVNVSGCFFSVSLRSQFNVVIEISFYFVRNCPDIQEQIALKDIVRTIGDSPDDKAIQEAVLNANREKPFSIYDSFEAVWDLLR